jgi:hypothetical protein
MGTSGGKDEYGREPQWLRRDDEQPSSYAPKAGCRSESYQEHRCQEHGTTLTPWVRAALGAGPSLAVPLGREVQGVEGERMRVVLRIGLRLAGGWALYRVGC